MGTSQVLDAAARSTRIEKYLSGERWNLSGFLIELTEFDRLGQYRELGYGTLWSYCERHLKLPKGQCQRRTAAVAVIRKFPQVVDFVRDGQLCLSAVFALSGVLTFENVDALLVKASGKTVEEVEYLAACERPKQTPPESSVRKYPTKTESATQPASGRSEDEPAASLDFSAPAPERRSEIKPVCEDVFLLKVPLTLARREKLTRVTEILGHSVPGGKVEDVLEYLFDLAISREEKRRKGTGKVRTKKTARVEPFTAAGNRAGIPIDVQRIVWERDQGRCTFKMPNGERCGSTKFPQFHHDPPVTQGGKNIPEHLCIHCREHNHLEAVWTYGADFMAQFSTKNPPKSKPP